MWQNRRNKEFHTDPTRTTSEDEIHLMRTPVSSGTRRVKKNTLGLKTKAAEGWTSDKTLREPPPTSSSAKWQSAYLD